MLSFLIEAPCIQIERCIFYETSPTGSELWLLNKFKHISVSFWCYISMRNRRNYWKKKGYPRVTNRFNTNYVYRYISPHKYPYVYNDARDYFGIWCTLKTAASYKVNRGYLTQILSAKVKKNCQWNECFINNFLLIHTTKTLLIYTMSHFLEFQPGLDKASFSYYKWKRCVLRHKDKKCLSVDIGANLFPMNSWHSSKSISYEFHGWKYYFT